MSRDRIFLGILVVLTSGNIGYRVWSGPASERNSPAGLTIGTPLPALSLALLGDTTIAAVRRPIPESGCRVLILFSPTCPHCHTAARRDAATADSLLLERLWISHTDDSATTAFAREIGSGAAIRSGGPAAFEAMKVKGVPAAFVISGANTVRWAGGYAGGADYHRLIRGHCE